MPLLLFSTVQPCPRRLTYPSSAQRFQGQSRGHTKIQSVFQQRIPNSLELGLKLTEGLASPPADKPQEDQVAWQESKGLRCPLSHPPAGWTAPSSWTNAINLNHRLTGNEVTFLGSGLPGAGLGDGDTGPPRLLASRKPQNLPGLFRVAQVLSVLSDAPQRQLQLIKPFQGHPMEGDVPKNQIQRDCLHQTVHRDDMVHHSFSGGELKPRWASYLPEVSRPTWAQKPGF